MASMKEKCRVELSKQIGRELSKTEADKISSALSGAMRELNVANPDQFRAMSPTQRHAAAVKHAQEKLVSKAVDAKINSANDALKLANNKESVKSLPKGQQINQIFRMTADLPSMAKSFKQSAESRAESIVQESWSQMASLQNMLVDNTRMDAFIHAIRGENIDDPLVMKAAKEYNDNMKRMVAEAKAAGMPITGIDNWHTPQGLSSHKAAAHFEDFKADLLSVIDEGMYIHDDGTKYTPEELKASLTRPL
jgi:ribosomal protein L12E/L44/L45/RPP1/RPP2